MRLTFDKPNDDHDKPPIVVMVVGMVDPNSNLADSDHLLHGYENKLYRQEADTLVEDVQGTVEGQVPGRQYRINLQNSLPQDAVGSTGLNNFKSKSRLNKEKRSLSVVTI